MSTETKKKSSIPAILLTIFLLVLMGLALSPTLLDTPIIILFGWILYPQHIAPNFAGFSYGMIKVLVLFVGLVIGLRKMLLWMDTRDHAQQKYSWKNCLLFMLMVMITFLASMASLGVLHQVAWLSRDGIQVTNSSGIPLALATRRILDSPNEKDAWEHLQYTQKQWSEYQFVYIPNEKLPAVVVIPVPDARHYPGTTSIKVYAKTGRYVFKQLSAQEIITSIKNGVMPAEK